MPPNSNAISAGGRSLREKLLDWPLREYRQAETEGNFHFVRSRVAECRIVPDQVPLQTLVVRRRLDLLSPLVTALDLLEKDNVRILFAQKGDRACKTHLGLVRILFIPDLAILHVESQRAEHRFPVPCRRALATSIFLREQARQ